jgi:protein involved in polysaccharide export with SLBB domain
MGKYIASRVLALALAMVAGVLVPLGQPPVASAQSETQPIPLLDTADHLLAEGDYLLAQFYDGQQQQDYYLQVDGAGEVRMPLIDAVTVAGLTPREASDLLTDKYTRYYHNPYVTLQVLSYGKFEVFVFGPDFPGRTYQVDNGTRLLDVINNKNIFHDTSDSDIGHYRRIHLIRGDIDFNNLMRLSQAWQAAGGGGVQALNLPSPSAVSRNETSLAALTNWRAWLQARTKDSQVWVVDPLQLTVEGELSQYNFLLQRRDVIYIPTPERFVDVGGVAVPGRYELLGDETLGDILRLAGSVSYTSDLINTVITRYDDCGNLERLVFNLFPALDQPELIADFKLQNRDIIRIVPRENRVFVLGEVKLAGAFDFVEDSTVLDYIALAGGETPEAHLTWIAIIRQGRNRLDQLNQAEVIQANFKEIHKGLPLCTDISLLPGDVIYVPPKGESFNLSNVLQALGSLVTTFAVVDSANNGSN